MSILEAVLVLATIVLGSFAVFSAFAALGSKPANHKRRRYDLREIGYHKDDPDWAEASAHFRRSLWSGGMAAALMTLAAMFFSPG